MSNYITSLEPKYQSIFTPNDSWNIFLIQIQFFLINILYLFKINTNKLFYGEH